MNFFILGRSFFLNNSKTQNKAHQDLDTNETSFSMLRGDTLSINKILSRESSVGQSSRAYYRSTINIGVPFEWEKEPGTPINLPQEEVIPQQKPPTPAPPPSMQSLVLRRSGVDMKDSSWSLRFWLWRRRLRKNIRLKMYRQRRYRMRYSSRAKGNKVSSLDGDPDVKLVGWIHPGSKSSSSSMISSLNGSSNEQFESFRKGISFCCTTWRRHKS